MTTENPSYREGQRNPRWHATIQFVVIIAIAAGVGVAIYLQHSTIQKGLQQIGSIHWGWVVAAGLSEVLSMVGLALLYRDILRANEVRLAVPWIMACCITSNAISLSVPVIGSGIASRRTFRRFRQGGADATTASFALTMAGVVSTATMATVVVAGAVLSGNPAAAASGGAAAVVVVGAVVAVGVELYSERGRQRLFRITRFSLRVAKRLTHRPKGEPETVAQNALTSLQRMRLGVGTSTRIVVWGLLNWWADVACLLFSLRAVGIEGLAPGKVILVWVAGAGAASLSPTPGGIGAVEVAMVAALAAFRIRGPDAILAVLVYRFITFKIAGSLWAAVYEYDDRHRRHPAPTSTTTT